MTTEEPRPEVVEGGIKYVTCSCCLGLIPDTPEHNADFATRGLDKGYGMCERCTDWSFELTFKPIFEKLERSLNESNRAKWDALSDTQKAGVVSKLLDAGALSWEIG